MPDESEPDPVVHYTSYPKSRGDPKLEFSGWTVESMTPQVLIKHCLVINDWNYEEKMCTYGNQSQKGFFIYGKKKFSCSRCMHSNPLSFPVYKWVCLGQVLIQENIHVSEVSKSQTPVFKKQILRTSLAVQWLRLCPPM